MTTLSTTALLIKRIENGDEAASEELMRLCQPLLLRWAHGRIPYSQKQLLETHDLVQETLLRGLQRIGHIETPRPGAFLAYLRRIFINGINDSLRKAQPSTDLEQVLNSRSQFATEHDLDQFIQYESALAKLSEAEQELVVLRMEFGLSYAEIAESLNKPSPDAVRMALTRALAKLTDWLR